VHPIGTSSEFRIHFTAFYLRAGPFRQTVFKSSHAASFFFVDVAECLHSGGVGLDSQLEPGRFGPAQSRYGIMEFAGVTAYRSGDSRDLVQTPKSRDLRVVDLFLCWRVSVYRTCVNVPYGIFVTRARILRPHWKQRMPP